MGANKLKLNPDKTEGRTDHLSNEVTASGDQTAKVWDVRVGELLGTCKGHQCSLKSIAFSKFEKAVFCTGGRDGNIMVWDTRCNKKDGFYRQVKQISGAHNIMDKQTPSKLKKKKQSVKGLAPSVDFQQSVTVVLFQDEHTLISAGAVDGVIKVWDLRKNYSTYRQDPVPSRSFSYPGSSTRKLGYSSLVLNSTGTNLFANCTDDNIYMFSMSSLKTAPVSVFSGHQNSSFYVKSSISPDDQFLISGSSDQNAYIWKVSEPQLPPMMLLGHSQEVTSVAWCPSDFTKIATCSDDNTIKVWRLRRDSEEENLPDRSSLLGWTCQKKTGEQNGTGTLNYKQRTPAKVLPMHSPPVSSPQPAACAPPYTGDLPLSTNTPTLSSVKSPATTMASAKQAEANPGTSPKPVPPSMSIRQWFTKVPSPSLPLKGTKTLSPRKALAEISQILPEVAFTSKSPHLRLEMRAKRKLESSKEENMKQKFPRSCNCVTELDLVSKKFSLDHCALAVDSRPCGEDCLALNGLEQATPSPKESSPGSPCSPALSPNLPHPHQIPCGKIADKENGSPDKRNWLSALGDKLQTNKSSESNRLSNSIQSLRNPGTRRQEAGAGISSPRPITTTSVPMRKICTYFQQKSQEN
ncbi:denticleless protein homolog isoform X2 [Hemicordylus capensis]|uniref:denticleless protein homolog isoform X2 n=1 Tax=Hemicordylus capensis TaxID=884348 RepID=UPI0023024B22|nr:denticleless protein homolog isoform X2 [Hemicordylus capensis]